MKVYLLLLFLIPKFLSAGIFDWFYAEDEQITEFECPYNCGRWGTEAVRNIEWKFIHVLWELDRFYLLLESFLFHYDHHDIYNTYYGELPQTFDHPWYQRALDDKLYFSNFGFLRIENSFDDKNFYLGTTFFIRPIFKKDLSYQITAFEDVMQFSNKLLEIHKVKNFLDFNHHETSLYLEYSHLSEPLIKKLEDLNFWKDCCYKEVHSKIPYSISQTERYLHEGSNKEKKLASLNQELSNEKQRLFNAEQEIANIQKELDGHKEFHDTALEKMKGTYQELKMFVPLRLQEIKNNYSSILDFCISHHQSPSAYFNRAQFFFDQGLNMNCLEDIRKLLEMTPSEMLTEEMLKKIRLNKGTAESELALFDDAILTLSTYLQNHPRHKEAYIERAIAYFETGNFHSAIQDYVDGKTGPLIAPIWKDDLELAVGLIEGITSGANMSLVNFVPGMLSSVQGMGNGLWAFVTSPNEVSREFVSACKNAYHFIQSHGLGGTLKTLSPEIKELVEGGEQLSFQRQGELMGYLIGRHGVDFLLLYLGGKGITAYRDLRQANAILSLEKMALSVEKGYALEALYQQWWGKTAPIIEELKATKGSRIGNELYQQFKNHPLAENQVRQILHQAGFKTFSRPKGIPYEWNVNLSKNSGGMRYQLKVIGKDGELITKSEVRVMPGNPNSQWPSQRQPYVKHQVNGSYVDKNGNIVVSDHPEAHIPLSNYNFEKLSRLVPYE